MKGIIYKVTNKVNNKSYIGQTRYTLEFRWRQHQHKKDNTYFHNAIHKYGVENFSIEILEECEFGDLDSREIFYIAKYDTFRNGYNLTIGGGGNKRLQLDTSYDEIRELYLSGFSSNKIATLYNVDKATIVKILRALDVKLRSNKLSMNRQELLELVEDYRSGYSVRELAKRYDCSPSGLRDYLKAKGVDVRVKYSILENGEAQDNMIDEYLDGNLHYRDLLAKYHCSNNTFKKILSLHGVDKKGRKHHFKMTDKQCLECIKLFSEGMSVQKLADKYDVDKCTVYSMFKRYHVDYLTV